MRDVEGRKKERQPFSLAGLRPGDIWRLRGRPKEFVERYDYHTADGSVLFTKLRFRDTETLAKTFIQLTPAPDGSPRWLFGRASNGVDEVLYHLPEVVRAASAGGEVWIAEGEKDVDALRRLGLVATCNADGAGKWRGELADALKGCARVTIIADNDPGEAEAKRRSPGTREWWQGQRHATDIADSLEARGIPWRAFTLPDAGGFACKDAAEWLAATAKGDITDENAADLRARIEAAADAAPPWPRHLPPSLTGGAFSLNRQQARRRECGEDAPDGTRGARAKRGCRRRHAALRRGAASRRRRPPRPRHGRRGECGGRRRSRVGRLPARAADRGHDRQGHIRPAEKALDVRRGLRVARAARAVLLRPGRPRARHGDVVRRAGEAPAPRLAGLLPELAFLGDGVQREFRDYGCSSARSRTRR